MNTRIQSRPLFDAILNATTPENEEVAMKHLCVIAGDTDATGRLHNGFLDDQHDNMTLLMAAAKIGSVRIAKCIIDMITFYHQCIVKQPFNFDLTDLNGDTAIMHAARSGHIQIVQLLFSTNACDPTIKNKYWQNAATLASAGNHRDTEVFLLNLYKAIDIRRNSIFTAVNSKMLTPIGNATVNDHTQAMEATTKRQRRHTPRKYG